MKSSNSTWAWNMTLPTAEQKPDLTATAERDKGTSWTCQERARGFANIATRSSRSDSTHRDSRSDLVTHISLHVISRATHDSGESCLEDESRNEASTASTPRLGFCTLENSGNSGTFFREELPKDPTPTRQEKKKEQEDAMLTTLMRRSTELDDFPGLLHPDKYTSFSLPRYGTAQKAGWSNVR